MTFIIKANDKFYTGIPSRLSDEYPEAEIYEKEKAAIKSANALVKVKPNWEIQVIQDYGLDCQRIVAEYYEEQAFELTHGGFKYENGKWEEKNE